jgi:rhamnosyltransferase
MEKKPKVLVLLAAFNGTQWLGEQINSILIQSDVDVTLVISVDSSDDGTEALVDKFSKNDSRIQVLQHGQKFGGAAPNFYRLMRDVSFNDIDFVALSDQDDIWLDHKLAYACGLMHKLDSEAYSSNVQAFWPSGKTLLIDKAQKQTDWDFIFEAAGPGCTYVFTIELARKLKTLVSDNWDEVNLVGLHDWLFYAYARAQRFKWVIDSRSFVLYRQHGNNQVGVNLGIKAFRYRLLRVLSGWGFSQALTISKIIGISKVPFIISWRRLNRWGILKLAFKANVCRRRVRDKFIFFFLCLLYALSPRCRGE